MDLKDLLRFMSQHKDMYLVTDSKNAQASIGFINDDKYNEIFWESFITIAKNIDRSILERVIPQIYYPKMLTIINKYYKFKRYIFTLYATNMNDDAVLKFVYENPSIYYITMPPNRVNNYDFIEKLLQLKRKTFIHTINNIDEMIFYRKKGIFGFYTDFIIPSQIKDVL
jgi:glycerophosphoryl diester phosphodiesterase